MLCSGGPGMGLMQGGITAFLRNTRPNQNQLWSMWKVWKILCQPTRMQWRPLPIRILNLLLLLLSTITILTGTWLSVEVCIGQAQKEFILGEIIIFLTTVPIIDPFCSWNKETSKDKKLPLYNQSVGTYEIPPFWNVLNLSNKAYDISLLLGCRADGKERGIMAIDSVSARSADISSNFHILLLLEIQPSIDGIFTVRNSLESSKKKKWAHMKRKTSVNQMTSGKY